MEKNSVEKWMDETIKDNPSEVNEILMRLNSAIAGDEVSNKLKYKKGNFSLVSISNSVINGGVNIYVLGSNDEVISNLIKENTYLKKELLKLTNAAGKEKATN